jgi:hypothetical protein
MSELLKKLATQFGYEGREKELAAELRVIVREVVPATVDDFPQTPAASLVQHPQWVENANAAAQARGPILAQTAEEAKARHVGKPKGK